MALSEAPAVWLSNGEGVKNVVSGFETVICAGALDDEADASAESDDRMPPGFEIGTTVVSVWSGFEMTTGTDTTVGMESLCEACARAVEIAPPGLESAIEVTTVLSERVIVIGTDSAADLLVSALGSEPISAVVLGFGLGFCSCVVVAGSVPSSVLVVGFGKTPPCSLDVVSEVDC